MNDTDTLRTLERVSGHRPPPTERRLVCGACIGEVTLVAGSYACQTPGCGAKYSALRDLAAVTEDGRAA